MKINIKLFVLLLLMSVGCNEQDPVPKGYCGSEVIAEPDQQEGLAIQTVFGPAILSLQYGLIVPCNAEIFAVLDSVPDDRDAYEIRYSGKLENYVFDYNDSYKHYKRYTISLREVTLLNNELTFPNEFYLNVLYTDNSASLDSEKIWGDTSGYYYRIGFQDFSVGQISIPVVGGNQLFKTYTDAKKTVHLVGHKLLSEGGLPSLIRDDLDVMLIQYDP